MPAASNDNGRSLEFLIVRSLSNRHGSRLTQRASTDQARDQNTIQRVNPGLRRSLREAAELVADWVTDSEVSESGTMFEIDRHSDSDLGVADLSIKHRSGTLALSIKHNPDALSHPRPYSLVQWLGFRKGSNLDLDHRRRMQLVSNIFRQTAGGARLFSEVPDQKWSLFEAVCAESVSTLQTAIKEDGAASLFNHLVGHGFKKVIVRTDRALQALTSIEVVDYSGIEAPAAITPSVDVKQGSISLDIEFDNGWKIDMRIHNASSRISDSGQLSLKFDAQREFGPKLPTTRLFPRPTILSAPDA